MCPTVLLLIQVQPRYWLPWARWVSGLATKSSYPDTYIASISSIVYSRAIPVLAEVDQTFNLDPADVEAKINPRTKAIIAVHMMGNPARLD